MVSKAILSHQAYVGILLHTAKYPHQPVNGILLGSIKPRNEILVERTIPLLHHWTSLSPMMEIGLDLAAQSASEANLHIVGYYQASPNLHESGLGPVGEKILAKLRENVPAAVGLLIYLDKLTHKSTSEVPGISAHSPVQLVLQNQKSPERITELIASGLQAKYADFDDHLEDVTLDWLRNPECVDKEFEA